MEYSIGQVAKKLGLTTHTLRFYDKEGVLQTIRKNSVGMRRYSEEDLNRLLILECLKSTGLSLKDIKHYFELCAQGDESLSERMQIFVRQKERLMTQMAALKENMERINFKISYYQSAMESGEKNVYQHNKKLAEERERLFQVKNRD